MTTAIKRRRGTTAQHSTFTGLEGELTVDTTKDTVVVHDGAVAGGYPLLREDLANNTDVTTNTGTQTLTNKTINLANNTLTATSAQIAAAVSDETGTGVLVFSESPALTGTPTAPTAAAGTNTTQLATTAHVFAERSNTATLTNKTIRQMTQVVSTSTNAAASNIYVITASLTLTLPSAPSVGDWVGFSNRSDTTTSVIARNGENIMGLAEDMTLDDVNASGTLVYADSTRGWVFVD
jgi:hypothetical protein